MASAYDYWKEGGAGIDEAAELLAERIAEKAGELIADDRKLSEIVSDVSADFMAETHDEAWVLLYHLHEIEPSDLLNSQVITDLYRLAKQIHKSANDRAHFEAEVLVNRESRIAAREHAEFLAERRAAA